MKTMKTNIILLIMILSAGIASAQLQMDHPPRKQTREDIESMKIAFITSKLELTPAEAQQFWPVYNEYSSKVRVIRKNRRTDLRAAREDFKGMSDAEIEKSVDNEMIWRQKELDIQKEYHAKFKSVLPARKVAKLYSAEEQFKKVLIDRLKDRGHH